MTEKRKRGRPCEKFMPEPVPDTPENIARTIMQGAPKAEWDFKEQHQARQRATRSSQVRWLGCAKDPSTLSETPL